MAFTEACPRRSELSSTTSSCTSEAVCSNSRPTAASFETWFTRILINCCLDELRKRKNSPGHEDIDEQYDLADSGPGTEAQILKKERQKAVTDAIRQLPEEARNIIILREFQGLSYEELADVLDLEPGTVKSRLNRAKQKLKEILLQSMEQKDLWDV